MSVLTGAALVMSLGFAVLGLALLVPIHLSLFRLVRMAGFRSLVERPKTEAGLLELAKFKERFGAFCLCMFAAVFFGAGLAVLDAMLT